MWVMVDMPVEDGKGKSFTECCRPLDTSFGVLSLYKHFVFML